MNTPIKHPPRPPLPAQSGAVTPAPAAAIEKRPALAGLRRSDAERLRALCDEPGSPSSLNADGMLFSQLLIAPVTEQQEQSGFAGSHLNLAPPPDGVPTQLVDELAQRLPAQPDGPLRVNLLMPSLGRVQVNASKRDNQWNIELGFARRGVLKRLQRHERACASALEKALGCDVDLSLQEDSQA